MTTTVGTLAALKAEATCSAWTTAEQNTTV